jgi:protein-serine/threonine kinase
MMLTERAARMRGSGGIAAAGRWLRRHGVAPAPRPMPAADPELAAPIVMAAIDFAGENAKLAGALRAATRRILETEPGARLACVNVFQLARLRIDSLEDEEGRNIHLRRLAELQHWARPLAAHTKQTTFHVIEAADPAAALVEFAQRNHADHLVIGARASSRMRRYLGSVSAQVVAEAPCTVTVVRTR